MIVTIAVNGFYKVIAQSCLFFLFFCTAQVVVAQSTDPVRLYGKDRYLLNQHMAVLRDETNSLTIDQVLSKEYQEKFYRDSGGIINLGVTPHTYWLKFSLQYPDEYPNTGAEKQGYLEIGKSLLSVAELYIPQDDGSYFVKSSDTRLDYHNKEVVHVNSVFPVSLLLGEEITLYIKIRNESSALYFSLIFWDPPAFVVKTSIEEFVYGVFFGGMFLLLIYNLFVYISVKDDSYFYYVLYLGCVSLFELIEIGHGTLHFKEFFDVVGKEYTSTVVWVALWCGINFFRTFLNAKEDYRRVDRLCKIMLWMVVISGAISFIRKDHVSIIWVSFFAITTFSLFLTISLHCWLKGDEHAKFFFYAWSCNGIGLTIYAAMAIEILPSNYFTIASAPVGIILESVVFSFALAERIKVQDRNRLEADKRVVENMSRYRSVFDNALEGMYRMSIDGLLTNANPSLAKIMGCVDVSDVMKNSCEVTSKLYQSGDTPFLELKNEGLKCRELSFEGSDGVTVWVNHSAHLVYDLYGESTHIEGVVVDVTEIKEKEEAVKGELEERIGKNVAMAATEEKSRFLTVMNQRIREPLTAIIGYSESLQSDEINHHDKKNYVISVADSSRNLMMLINDILDYSKIDAGKLNLEEIPFSIIEVAEKVRKSIVRNHREKPLEFRISYHFPLPSCQIGDPFRLQQVIQNLCRNLLTNSAVRDITLTITWENGKCTCTVIDTDSNFNQRSITPLFRQVSPEEINAEFQGEDLGIPISNKLIGLMGGGLFLSRDGDKVPAARFDVNAELADGATLIRSQANRDVIAKEEFIEGSKNNGSTDRIDDEKLVLEKASLSGVVLLAEDNVINQKLVSKLIEKLGVTVDVVCDGIEACNYCERQVPDLILMDINMPNRNGLEATRYIRERWAEIPIYALTAETDSKELDQAIAAGCQGVLCKPLNKQRIHETIIRYLSTCPLNDSHKEEIKQKHRVSQYKTVAERRMNTQAASVRHLKPIDADKKKPPTGTMRFSDELPQIREFLVSLSVNKRWEKLEEVAVHIRQVAERCQLGGLTQSSGKLIETLQKNNIKDVAKWVSSVDADILRAEKAEKEESRRKGRK